MLGRGNSWPPDANWPFVHEIPADHLASHNHRAVRFTFSHPHPLPMLDLSRIADESLVSFSYLKDVVSPYIFRYPRGPYHAHRDGPFVTLDFEMAPTAGPQAEQLIKELQPLWWLAQGHRPTRQMRMVAAIQMQGVWTDVARLDVSLDPTPPDVAPHTLSAFPLIRPYILEGRQIGRVEFETYKRGISVPRSPYARYAVIKKLIMLISEVARQPPHQRVDPEGNRPFMWHVGGPYLDWHVRLNRVSTRFDNAQLLAALHVLLTTVEQYGAFETEIAIWIGNDKVTTMHIYE